MATMQQPMPREQQKPQVLTTGIFVGD